LSRLPPLPIMAPKVARQYGELSIIGGVGMVLGAFWGTFGFVLGAVSIGLGYVFLRMARTRPVEDQAHSVPGTDDDECPGYDEAWYDPRHCDSCVSFGACRDQADRDRRECAGLPMDLEAPVERPGDPDLWDASRELEKRANR